MNLKFRPFVFMVAALLLGLASSELLYRSARFRDLAGRLAARGRLVAIVNVKGIYEADLGGEDEPSAAELVVLEHLKQAAADESVDLAKVEREISLLKAQFGDDKVFNKALGNDGLTISDLREKVAEKLRGLAWLEKRVESAGAATDEKCRQFFDAHHDLFMQPVRFRASHLFLAAHAETAPEVVEEKELAIAAFAARLNKGETLAALAAEASEDEATKSRGGDLGYFAETRALPEFVAEIRKLRVGESSKPFRSHLGFHIAQVTETKAARLLTFDEARPEILLAVANDHRAARMRQITQELSCSD
jgi:parvulin-like peptidyl-prolyl isomerase